jgi:hypothetical protein
MDNKIHVPNHQPASNSLMADGSGADEERFWGNTLY